MKSNSIFFTALNLAAPLAFLSQGSALAQADSATNTPPTAEAAGLPAASPRDEVDFFFPGGTPSEFVAAVEKQYKVDWAKVVDIPDKMRAVHIPALRMNLRSAESMSPGFRGRPGGGGGGFGGFGGGAGGASAGGGGSGGGGRRGVFAGIPENRDPLEALIALYNSLGQAIPELGELMVRGDLAKPSVVIFRSIYANTTPDVTLKAFALNGIPANQWEKLAQEIEVQNKDLNNINRRFWNPNSFARINRDSGLLIVRGVPSDLAVAESLVAAWHANYAAPVPPSGLPGQK